MKGKKLSWVESPREMEERKESKVESGSLSKRAFNIGTPESITDRHGEAYTRLWHLFKCNTSSFCHKNKVRRFIVSLEARISEYFGITNGINYSWAECIVLVVLWSFFFLVWGGTQVEGSIMLQGGYSLHVRNNLTVNIKHWRGARYVQCTTRTGEICILWKKSVFNFNEMNQWIGINFGIKFATFGR